MKFLVKVPDQVAFAILRSWYHSSYLTECRVAVKRLANMDSTTGHESFDMNRSLLHTNRSWLIGGQFGQALCKLVPFFTDVSSTVSIQNLVLITVDRWVAVVFPLRSPLIRSKLCPFFILGTWIAGVAVISPQFFTFQLVENSVGKMICVMRWEEAFGESLSFADYQLAGSMLFRFIPVMLLAILYSIMLFKLKARAHPGEQSANTQQQRNRRNRNVLQMSIAIVL